VSELTQALDTRVTEIGPLPNNLESLVKSSPTSSIAPTSGSRDQVAFDPTRTADRRPRREDRRCGPTIRQSSAIERGIQQLTLQVRAAPKTRRRPRSASRARSRRILQARFLMPASTFGG